MKGMTSIETAARKVAELDAAGWALVVLRADSEADIRRVVEQYPHKRYPVNRTKSSRYENVSELSGDGIVRNFFILPDFARQGKDEAEGLLFGEWIGMRINTPDVGMRHDLIYIPDLVAATGPVDMGASQFRERTPDQRQCVFLLRALCEEKRKGAIHSLVIVGSRDGHVPPELAEYRYIVDVECPGKDEIDDIIREACEECGGPRHGLEPGVANELAEISRGMRRDEIRAMIALAYAQDEYPLANGAEQLFRSALDAKRQRISNVKGLRWIGGGTSADVGGLEEVKKWLGARKFAFNYTFAAKKFKVAPPKGILLAGLPGCGKTLFAKFASHLLGDGRANRTPVLQLDLNAIPGKYVGETEPKFFAALRVMESVAPCVVVVDEIEKFFGGVADSANESSRHVLSAFLDWMQADREKPVLVIATANKVDRLPPELKRKGRFDETFFVGIPTRKSCAEILRLQFVSADREKDRRRILVGDKNFDLDSVIGEFLNAAAAHEERTSGKRGRFFNGADLEVVVNSAFCTMFSRVGESEVKAIQASGEDDTLPERLLYTEKDVRDALIAELGRTRSYFDNNMEETASYWMLMHELNFRNAGGDDLFDGVEFLKDTGEFKFAGVEAEGKFKFDDGKDHARQYLDCLKKRADGAAAKGDYDDAFRYTLAQSIFDVARKSGRQ